jgi:signal transduction histidine kinase
VLNLLDNAVKYSKEHVDVSVDLGRQSGLAVLTVSDHGIGMTRAHLRFVFNRFYRIGPEVRRSRTGTGLGLYIVRSVVKGHKGTVTADSPGPDRGATFTVTLPEVPEAQADDVRAVAHG